MHENCAQIVAEIEISTELNCVGHRARLIRESQEGWPAEKLIEERGEAGMDFPNERPALMPSRAQTAIFVKDETGANDKRPCADNLIRIVEGNAVRRNKNQRSISSHPDGWQFTASMEGCQRDAASSF